MKCQGTTVGVDIKVPRVVLGLPGLTEHARRRDLRPGQ